ncbi:MAG: hypothetical protein M1819_001356 [Sarea resinae]|nr:MAG: hypothetical protein M1819_001356 [Sarea resinae]
MLNTGPLLQVSKDWKRILSSEEICRRLLLLRFPDEAASLTCQPSNVGDLLLRRSKRWHAFQYGRPYSKTTLVIDFEREQLERTAFAYHDGNLAFINESGTGIVTSLDDGSLYRLIGPDNNRDSLLNLAVSKSLICGISALGFCYVSDYIKDIHRSFRLPRVSFKEITSNGRCVCVFEANTDKVSGIIWDFESEQSRSFEISHRGRDIHLGLHPKEDSIFVISWDETAICRFSRYTFDGTELGSQVFTIDRPFMMARSYFNIHPRDRSGRMSLFYGMGMSSSDLTMEDGHFVFDPKYDRLMKHEYPFSPLKQQVAGGQKLWQEERWPDRLNLGFCFEEMVYTVYIKDGFQPMIVIRDLHEQTLPVEPEVSTNCGTSIVPRDPPPLERQNYFLCGDDKFLVLLTESGAEIFCFDEDIRLPDEDSSYRDRRRKRLEERLAKQA